MAITFEKLQEFLKKAEIKYYIAPDQPVVRFIMLGQHGKHDLTIQLQLEGQFLQFRTMGYHACPAVHVHVLPTLKLLGEMNFKRRLVKFGWDPSDGEIVMYADIWLMDNAMTSAQFDRMLGTFLSSSDIGTLRIQTPSTRHLRRSPRRTTSPRTGGTA